MLVLLPEVPGEVEARPNCFRGMAVEVEEGGMNDRPRDTVAELAVDCHMLMDLKYSARENPSAKSRRERIEALPNNCNGSPLHTSISPAAARNWAPPCISTGSGCRRGHHNPTGHKA